MEQKLVDYELIAEIAQVLIEDVRSVTGKELSINTAVQCVMLEQAAFQISEELKDIAAEIYKNCT